MRNLFIMTCVVVGLNSSAALAAVVASKVVVGQSIRKTRDADDQKSKDAGASVEFLARSNEIVFGLGGFASYRILEMDVFKPKSIKEDATGVVYGPKASISVSGSRIRPYLTAGYYWGNYTYNAKGTSAVDAGYQMEVDLKSKARVQGYEASIGIACEIAQNFDVFGQFVVTGEDLKGAGGSGDITVKDANGTTMSSMHLQSEESSDKIVYTSEGIQVGMGYTFN